MFFYYVKDDSTLVATSDAGRTATLRTGTFAAMGTANYYASIYAVFNGDPATAPVSGDFVLVSNTHDKSYTAATTLGVTDGVTVMSVDDTAVDSYLKGAMEYTTGVYDLTAPAAVSGTTCELIGMVLKAGDDVLLTGNADAQTTIYTDCDLHLTGTHGLDAFKGAARDGSKIVFNNVRLYFGNTGQAIFLNQCGLVWNGGSVESAIVTLFEQAGNNCPGAKIVNVDLTNITSSVSVLLGNIINDSAKIELQNCLLASGTVLDSTPNPSQINGSIIGRSIGYGTATDTMQYFQERYYTGSITQDETVYRNAGATYNRTNNFSAEMAGNINTSLVSPLKFELSNFYIDTSDYTTDITFTVHFAVDGATTVLDSDEFWVEIEHKDGADNALGVIVDNKAEPLVAGTAPTTEAGLWTIGATNKQMSISKTIAIGTTAGTIATGVVRVNVYLSKAGQTVFVCPAVELS